MGIRDRARRRIRTLLGQSPQKKTESNDSVSVPAPAPTPPPTPKPSLSNHPAESSVPPLHETASSDFQVTTQDSQSYESDYISNDAPVRLAHHAAAINSDTEYSIQIDVPNAPPLHFSCQAGEFVLDAADRSGLELPYSCRSGGCLCCAARVVSGQVQQAEQYVLEPEHLEQGFVLLCCCTVSGDAHFIGHQEDNID